MLTFEKEILGKRKIIFKNEPSKIFETEIRRSNCLFCEIYKENNLINLYLFANDKQHLLNMLGLNKKDGFIENDFIDDTMLSCEIILNGNFPQCKIIADCLYKAKVKYTIEF